MKQSTLIKNKSAQAWGTDLVIAIMIFSFGIIIFYTYSLNYSDNAEDTLKTLIREGNKISDSILSEGYPNGWNQSNVVRIGILDNNKINETKLAEFYTLSKNDYNLTKSLFDTPYDYYFFLDDPMIIDSIEVEGIGKPDITLATLDPKNLIKITRFTVYQNKPETAYLFVFEE